MTTRAKKKRQQEEALENERAAKRPRTEDVYASGVGIDEVAYFAAELAVSSEPWHRELGRVLGEGLNRVLSYRFRALVFLKLDALYADSATPGHMPLSRHLLLPWLAARFPAPVVLPDLTHVYDSDGPNFLPIQFFSAETRALLANRAELNRASTFPLAVFLVGAITALISLWSLRHATARWHNLASIAMLASVASTPLLLFFEKHVLHSNRTDSPLSMLFLTVRTRRARGVVIE